MKATTKRSILIFISAAFICLGCLTSIPTAASFPMTFQDMFAVIVACILGGLNGAGATGIFIMIGTIGAPVFLGFHGGISYLLGQYGGFIAGYFLGSIASGLVLGTPHTFEKKLGWKLYAKVALTAVAGYALVYLTGAAWYSHILSDTDSSMTFIKSISICITPYLYIIIGKLALTVLASSLLRPAAAKIMYPPEDDEAIFEELKRKSNLKANKK